MFFGEEHAAYFMWLREAFNDDSDKRCIKYLEYFSLLTSYFFLGFELTIDHPHTHVVKCTQLVRGKESQLAMVLLNCFTI